MKWGDGEMSGCGGQKARGERLMSKWGPKFKELRVWQKGKELAVYIYQSNRIYPERNIRKLI